MANPTGHTYRYGEHHPLTESGGPSVVYRESPVPYPQMVESARADLQERASAPFAGPRGDVWERVLLTIRRFPIVSCLAVLGAGFLIAQRLVRGTRDAYMGYR